MTMETIARVAARFFSKERDESYIIECETSSGCPLMNELDKASLLDARIIRGACPTCGGIGQVPATHMPAGATERCPDCANTPVWVIEPAAWEAFVCSCIWLKAVTKEEASRKWRMPHQSLGELLPGEPDECEFDEWWAWVESIALSTLQALLPGVKSCKEVEE